MTFGIYVAGALITIAGLGYAAVLLKVPGQWIAAGGIVILGLAILSGVKSTRQKDPS